MVKSIVKISKFICAVVAVAIIVTAASLMFCACNTRRSGSDIIVIGTTSAIEKAVRDEYAYDMLASGVSEPPLISKSANGEFKPLIASYKTLDSINWTYTVCEGMRWSDGVEVTADDIVFSLEYEANGDVPAFTDGDKKGKYESFTISDDGKSVTLVSAEANVKALEDMTVLRIRPKHVYEGKTSVTEEEARVSCGPYVLTSFNKQANALTFEINGYYPQKPNFSKIIYKTFGSEDIMYAALLNGELDMIWNYSLGVPSAYQDILAQSQAVKLVSAAASNCPAMLVFNNSNGLFADKNVRFAASYALDYDAFKTYFGSPYSQTPNRSFAPPSLSGYKQTEQLVKDYSKAAEFMKAAGYVKGSRYWEKDGVAAQFDLTVNSGKSMQLGYAEFVKTQLEEFGIKVNLDSVNSVTYNVRTSNKYATEQGGGVVTMQAAIMGFTAYGMKNFGDMYIDGNHPVQGGAQVFSDALTQIITEMESARTLDAYKIAAGRLQDFYAQETPAVALFWDNLIYAHSASLDNVLADGTFGLNNVQNWFSIIKR